MTARAGGGSAKRESFLHRRQLRRDRARQTLFETLNHECALWCGRAGHQRPPRTRRTRWASTATPAAHHRRRRAGRNMGIVFERIPRRGRGGRCGGVKRSGQSRRADERTQRDHFRAGRQMRSDRRQSGRKKGRFRHQKTVGTKPTGSGGLIMADSANAYHHLFGPVPSRRLGRSLGIDLVPFKTCSLNCIYCECGATTRLTIKRAAWSISTRSRQSCATMPPADRCPTPHFFRFGRTHAAQRPRRDDRF